MARVRFFAQARDAAGCREADVEGDTVAGVLEAAVGRFGAGLGEVIATSTIWVNGERASPPAESARPTSSPCSLRSRAADRAGPVGGAQAFFVSQKIVSISAMLVEKPVGHGDVVRLLRLAGGLRRLPEQVVQLGCASRCSGLK